MWLGIITTIVGFIILFMRFKCDEMVGIGFGLFVGGIAISLLGYFGTIPELCPCN